MIDKNASRLLVLFMQRFTDLQEKHLVGIHQTMRETVDGIMNNINLISERTRRKTEEAHDVLMKTYTQPDLETVTVLNETQQELESLIRTPGDSKNGSNASAQSIEELRKKLLKNAGYFSRSMERFATLDSEVQELLFSMMGQLSRDDVITQRIEHVIMALRTLQTDLTYLLQDFETRCTEVEINRFIKNIKNFSLRIYTMQEERNLHFEIFNEDKSAKKKQA
jgi:hypothetical protein